MWQFFSRLYMDQQIIKQQLDSYKMFEKKFRSDLLLVLVANVEGKTKEFDDYSNTSVLSEYYTLNEYELISGTYKRLGYELLNYFSEKDFMSAVIDKKIHTSHKKIFVINSAQTGIYVGRKSLIPAFCDYFKIMYTGSNPHVVSLCRDKFCSSALINKYLSRHLDAYLYSTNGGWAGSMCPPIGQKVIAKLNGESASIGLTQDNVFIYTPESECLLNSLSQKYAQSIIVQPFISGYEAELPVVIGKSFLPLMPVGIRIDKNCLLGDKILDYDARFYHSYDFYNFSNANYDISEELRIHAVQAAELLGIEGFGRIDYRITPEGNFFISDVATNPHITSDSSYAFAFNELGYSYSDMLSVFLGISLTKYFSNKA